MVGPRTELGIASMATAAQVTAQLAPIPGMYFAGELLSTIYSLCENVAHNRHSARLLRDRCAELAYTLSQLIKGKEMNDTMRNAKEAVERCLLEIQIQMSGWTQLGKIESFTRQNEIKKSIEICLEKVHICETTFNLVSAFENHDWQQRFEHNARMDHDSLVAYLSDIQNGLTLNREATHQNSMMVQQMMGMMQMFLGQNIETADRVHHGLSNNLYQLQLRSGELLPDFHLKNGEVKRVGAYPVSGSAAMDIYEGLYLDNEKVAVKIVRAINSSEASLRRFKREVKIWSEVWKRDQGRHILPFFGFCQTEGPYPYMVSPWQKNGNALKYVEKNDRDVDHVQLVIGIAKGLQLLHSMKVIHGDLKAANVLIDIHGNPLIADFGLSQIVEDVTGIPFTQSRGVSDSYRWFAPEVCVGQGVLSMHSDVYAYGMTILELMTHSQPYSNLKHTPEVVIRSSQGEGPPRPAATETRVIERGLDDNMWSLLLACWAKVPSQRPSMTAILAQYGVDPASTDF